jgi:hypothetical protein
MIAALSAKNSDADRGASFSPGEANGLALAAADS